MTDSTSGERLAGDDIDWQDRAACTSYHPTGLFFDLDDVEPPAERRRREEQAKAICAICDVRVECLEFALKWREVHGIWGGTTEAERRQILRRSKLS
ncbi:MAG TPA: WhiB family transcriptional regulator [Actinomycetota bacterium]|jgi:WhiB family redox-sensing transcriptional regulator|nr:WhiB family transcriptional regulator [Actinomycetota bacterium]